MPLVHQSVLARPAGVPRAEGRGADGGVEQLVGGPGGGAGGCGPRHLCPPHVWPSPPARQIDPEGACSSLKMSLVFL